ncbi:hypothetical protein [Butyribacter intestini]|jgi:uncharacterized membrane protein (DUF106 family)|uniref:hypothetical protein n=1 Tax=Butyribacter intestini TaxID=1703332 RepID=UPI000967C22C|nr:hypothetical protein [Butyribacter intestini]OKZ81476.1 MAG: hypothetical protein BHW08_01740 [Clostridium sp. CAG:12237_41]
MVNNKIEIINGIEVDTERAQKLVKKLIVKEKKNLSTKEKSNPEMIKEIKKMIEEAVECY